MALKKKKNNAEKPGVADDFLAQEAAQEAETAPEYTLDIPEDEIWTYKIDGLHEPHINKPFDHALRNKIIVVIVLIIAIGAALYFSFRAVHSDEYQYNQLEDGTYELVRFSNPGDVRDIVIDYVVDEETGKKDTSKPITVIHEYAFNCDETLNSITFGKDIKKIDGKSIYSCWYVRDVFVDDENPYYCDLDGVLYTKDLTQAVHYPNDHDKSIRLKLGYNVPTIQVDENGEPVDETLIKEGTTIDDYLKVDENNMPLKDKNGNFLQPELITDNLLFEDDGRIMEELWGTTKKYDEAYYQNYNRLTRTYVVPSTVTEIGELAFAYSNIVDLYIPEGVKKMDNMAVFKNTVLVNLYSYKTDKVISDCTYRAMDDMSEIYSSLPEGLEYIGSDCLYYLRGLNYLYVPSSVTTIKHHAFWETCYKEDKELKGVQVINTAYPDEKTFEDSVTTGDQWRPQYDYMLFKKSVDVNYDAKRESQYNYNVHRQYYWAVQWVKNNLSETAVKNSSYLVQDMDSDGTPELVLRKYNEKTKKTEDTVLTISYNYLDEFKGNADYSSAAFSAIDDEAQLDAIKA